MADALKSSSPPGRPSRGGRRPGAGRPLGADTYKPEYAAQAEKACQAGFTDQELADLFACQSAPSTPGKPGTLISCRP
jgi:hypothetical protein